MVSSKVGKAVKKTSNSENPPYKFTCTIHESHNSSVYGASFNPYLTNPQKGYFLATCGSRFLNIYKIYPKERRPELLLQFQDPNKEEGFYAVTWAYDRIVKRHVVIVAGAKAIIRVIDPIDKRMVNTLRGHGEAVNELRTSPNDSMIVASASKDRTARLWNIRNSDCLAIFGGANGHLDEDFDINQNFLLTASMDHTVRVWDLQPESDVGKRIIECRNKTVIESYPAVESQFPLAISRDVHTNYVDCCRFLGSFILSKACENKIVLWKFGSFDLDASGQGTLDRTETYVLHTIEMNLPKSETWFIKFDLHPENKFLACGNEVGQLHLWKLNNGKESPYPEEDSNFILTGSVSDPMTCVRQTAFSPRGDILIAVGEMGQITRFDSTDI